MSTLLAGGLVTGFVAPSAASASPRQSGAGANGGSATCVISGPTGKVQHVVEIVFDNVHYNRDNPNVLSDLEQIPALENFILQNGTLLSNNHTPLIAHTANDTIANYSGLYGDRDGVGISNDYYAYKNSGGASYDGNTANAANYSPTGSDVGSFSYWTGPSPLNSLSPPVSDPFPAQPYSSTVPAADPSYATPPAPWVPFTRSGCDVGDVSTSNQELENAKPDIQNVFGAGSPEQQQVAADGDSFLDQETNDYLGLAIHCADSDPVCTQATAAKYDQTSPSYSAVADDLPSEPGGYSGTSPAGGTAGSGYLALFGHKYLQNVLDKAGSVQYTGTSLGCTLYPTTSSFVTGAWYREVPSATVAGQEDCYEVADASTNSNVTSDGTAAAQTAAATDNGNNLVDLFGTEMDGQYAKGAGFPGFGPITAAQSLAYTADMQETGVPVTYSYISDLHEVKSFDTNCSAEATYKGAPDYGYALAPGDPCYYENSSAWNQAFQLFFQRLADDGITPANTLFVFGADEGDHVAAANVGRAIDPSSECTGTPLTTGYDCAYTSGQVGELEVNLHRLVALEAGDNVSFAEEPQGVAIYVNGDPGNPGSAPTAASRQLEREISQLTVVDPYDGAAAEKLTKWEVDAEGERLLHFVVADPARTPTFTMWPIPDAYFSDSFPSCSTATAANAASMCQSIYSKYADNHGYYDPTVDNTWAGIVGPGVQNLGLDGSSAGQGPNSSGNENTALTTAIQLDNPGTWLDQTDLRPTLLALTGLSDDYHEDGRVLTEVITPQALATSADSAGLDDPNFVPVAECYKQLNSSVGEFGTDVITSSTTALPSGSGADDSQYTSFETQLDSLGAQRDALAQELKDDLWNAEFADTPIPNAAEALGQCNGVLAAADNLAGINPPNYVPESPATTALPVLAIAILALGAGVVTYRRRRSVVISR
jgi:hypothetical protein